MELVCLDQHGIFEPEGRDSGGSYVVAVAQEREDFGEKIESPFGGVSALPRISLAVGAKANIVIDGFIDSSFLVRNAEIVARGKPDELGEMMPERVHKLFERFSLYSTIVYLVFKLPNDNRLWVENSFVALHE